MRDIADFSLEEAVDALKEMKATEGWRVIQNRLERRIARAKDELVRLAQTGDEGQMRPAIFAAHIDGMNQMLAYPDNLIAEYEARILQMKEAKEDAQSGVGADDYSAV